VNYNRYPIYIVSKTRHDSMLTSRSLARMKTAHNIVIEPQDLENYEKALDRFNLRPWVRLLVAPFSNHGDGPGRARNWAWDHSIEEGHTTHWVMDDNIDEFYRLHNNARYKVHTGAMFAAMEDFCDRYTNVAMAGPGYKFFFAGGEKYPAYRTNNRIYSCNMIRNDTPYRWRGRYNEDTIISLDILKAGLCTIQFCAFLQNKMPTQTVKGGNTDEFYWKEKGFDPETGLAIQAEDVMDVKNPYANPEGTKAKSQMLVDMFPNDAELVWKYGRWHHHVNYDPYKRNKLKFRDDFVMPTEPNQYGMTLKHFTEDQIKEWRAKH
jgi:hypothetical protein